MILVKFNNKPLAGTFSHLVDDLFVESPATSKKGFNNLERKEWVPVNVKQTEKSYQLDVVAPGFEKSDFNISLEQNLLTVSGEKKTGSRENGNEIRKEYSYSSFKRFFTLDDKIDATNIEASYINGILTLNLPMKETVKPTAMEIAIK